MNKSILREHARRIARQIIRENLDATASGIGSQNDWNTFVIKKDMSIGKWRVMQRGMYNSPSSAYNPDKVLYFPLNMTPRDIKAEIEKHYAPNRYYYEVVD